MLCKEVASSSLLGACGHQKNEFLNSTQDTKTASQTDHISDNRLAADLHVVSSVDKEGKLVTKIERKNGNKPGSFHEGKTY